MRQISGEVHAAAQASTCCDITGEESPNGAPRKMHAFCGVPGLEGGILTPRETNSLFEAYLNTTNSLFEVCLNTTKTPARQNVCVPTVTPSR